MKEKDHKQKRSLEKHLVDLPLSIKKDIAKCLIKQTYPTEIGQLYNGTKSKHITLWSVPG